VLKDGPVGEGKIPGPGGERAAMATGGAPVAEAKEDSLAAIRGAMRQLRAGPFTPLLFLAALWMLAGVAKWAQIRGATDGPLPLAPWCGGRFLAGG
jgi:hypothetical protein